MREFESGNSTIGIFVTLAKAEELCMLHTVHELCFYPLDATYDTLEDVPKDVKANKRYVGASNWTVQEVAQSVKQDFRSIDILVHSLANGLEVSKPLLETSRKGYLAAVSALSYSFVSLLKHFIIKILP